MNTLTNNNKARHPVIFQQLLPTLRLTDVFSGAAVQWPWGPLGRRLGSRRSADGVIFQLTGNKAAKFIFSTDDGPLGEVNISKIGGDNDISPKIYGAYRSPFNSVAFTQSIHTLGQTKGGHVNIFQNYIENPMERMQFNKVFIIVMEQFNGANLSEILAGDPGTGDIRIAESGFERLVNKMHALGIIHADLHMGNIFVDRTKGFRLIDFGRSLATGRPLTPNNANNFLNRRKTGVLNYFKTLNGLPSHVLVRGTFRYRNKAAITSAIDSIRKRKLKDNRQRYLKIVRQKKIVLKKKLQRARAITGKRAKARAVMKKVKTPSPTTTSAKLNALHKKLLTKGHHLQSDYNEYNKLWEAKYGQSPPPGSPMNIN